MVATTIDTRAATCSRIGASTTRTTRTTRTPLELVGLWVRILLAFCLIPFVCEARVLKEENVSVRYFFDVTRVDDVVLPRQPLGDNSRGGSSSKGGATANGAKAGAPFMYTQPLEEGTFLELSDERKREEEEVDVGNEFDTNHDDAMSGDVTICPPGLYGGGGSPFNHSDSATCQGTTPNASLVFGEQRYSKMYTAVACTLSAVIFLFGLLGNILVIIVISRTRSMHTTTNCYLLSLAVADSLVLLAATLPAIPETFFRVEEWPYGRVMCSILIFLQYLGLDSSSLSITAFTIERYIAICHPMRAQTMCTLSRAKRIIACLWAFTLLYCSPWLGLTEVKVYSIPGKEPMYRCQHRLARSSYLLLYMIDLILFYVIPLLIAIILYLLIGRILFLSRSMSKNIQFTGRGLPQKVSHRRTESRVQVVRMLVVVVVVFASLWMPYRVMVVYNSFAQHKYMDLWFLLFARTMVYANCAINPILYNIMSVKFKRAFRNYLSCWHRRDSLPPPSYNEMNTDVWATRRNTTNTTRLNHQPQPQSSQQSMHQLQDSPPQQQRQQQQQQQQQQQHQQQQQQSRDFRASNKCNSRNASIPTEFKGHHSGLQQSLHHQNSQKQRLLQQHGDNVVYVHQQQHNHHNYHHRHHIVCTAKNGSDPSNNNSPETNSSLLIENTV